MWRSVSSSLADYTTKRRRITSGSCCWISLSLYKNTNTTGISSVNYSTESDSSCSSTRVAYPCAPPIRVSVTESGAGRGVFATRRIEAGQLIHTAKPIASHPYNYYDTNTYYYSPLSTSTTSVCYLCLKNFNNNISEEEYEEADVFCSTQCQKHSKGFYDVEKQADWSEHTQHCRTQGLKYPFLAKRIACMVVSGVATAEALDILQPAILSCEMISQMEKEFTLLRSALEEAEIPDEKISFLTKQWYIGVLARLRINSFRIELVGRSYEDLLSLAAASVEAESAVGNALYMLPSFYNHDCDPNAHIVWIESVDARVKALRDIDEGEELRICYIDASMDYDARQRILSEGFGFKCGCLRCQSGD